MLKQYAVVAISQAIHDIITPVVERSVTIACITTRELLLKDFAMETDEAKVRRAAHLMVQHLAGSLALVTCKEPLRVSMCNQLRTYLQRQQAGDQQAIEQAVQVTAADNLEFGCWLIEKSAIERAMRDIDTALDNAINLRRKQGPAAFESPIFGARPQPAFMKQLPESLMPKASGLGPSQLRVYDDFARDPRQAPTGPAGNAPATATPMGSEGKGAVEAKPAIDPAAGAAAVSVAQSLQQCSAALGKLEQAATRAPPTATLAALPADNEVTGLVRQVVALVASASPRDEVAIGVAQKAFRRLFDQCPRLLREALVALLEGLRESCSKLVKELTTWLCYADAERGLNVEVILALARGGLLAYPDLDAHLSKLIAEDRNNLAFEVGVFLVKEAIVDNAWATPTSLGRTCEALRAAAAKGKGGEAVPALLADVQAVGKGEKPAGRLPQADTKPKPAPTSAAPTPVKVDKGDPTGMRSQVTALLDDWLATDTRNEKACAAYIAQLQQQHLLNGDDTTERFFRAVIEVAVERCIPATPDGPLNYAAVEATSKMVLLLVKFFAEPLQNKVQLVTKVLAAYVRAVIHDAQASGTALNQKPYHRLMHHLLTDLSSTDAGLEPVNLQVLQGIGNALHALRPAVIPCFAFAWLELVSHRLFMPKLLNSKNAKGWPAFHRLLIDLFSFLEQYLRHAELTEPVAVLYRGTLRVLLVLLHDFPELLCEYHFSLCDVIPPSGIQMRNLILSAFPRYIRPPDPFTPHLKVDLLPDIHKPPSIRSDVVAALTPPRADPAMRHDLETLLKSRQPPPELMDSLPGRLLHTDPALAQKAGTRYNVPLINALVLTVGTQAIVQAQTKPAPQSSLAPSASMDVFVRLARDLDTEGRYHFLNALANQLRYPNSHTHYFSCVLLFLFSEADKDVVKEQITRVLIERLIVNKPHPWGLLITFIELIRNPRYNFWSHEFVRAAKEIEMLFHSVARNCLPPHQASSVMTGKDAGGTPPGGVPPGPGGAGGAAPVPS